MRFPRTAGRGLLSALIAVLVGALGASPILDRDAPDHPAASRPPAPAGHVVLALGDSVPAGRACDCEPFPETYGSLLARRTGTRVTVLNKAVSGLDTSQLVTQLGTADVADAVRRSDVVLVTIGANDFADHHDEVVDDECTTTDRDCVSDELASLRDHLASVLATLRRLRQGQPTSVLVTGYWNVFEDGDVARRAYGTSGLRSSLRLTTRANAVIRSACSSSGARYVDLFRAFEEPGHDTTPLMAADGDHPDAAGHALIARALLDAGLPRTS
jgi:lysophospholipase L1-like esterase